MRKFECKDVPVFDYMPGQNCGSAAGEFTGTLRVKRDMCRVVEIDGEIAYREGATQLCLANLYVDIVADGEKVFCLFNDPVYKEPKE